MSVPTINFKVKKHIVAMFDDLSSLSKEELKERLKLCEEVFFFSFGLRFCCTERWTTELLMIEFLTTELKISVLLDK